MQIVMRSRTICIRSFMRRATHSTVEQILDARSLYTKSNERNGIVDSLAPSFFVVAFSESFIQFVIQQLKESLWQFRGTTRISNGAFR